MNLLLQRLPFHFAVPSVRDCLKAGGLMLIMLLGLVVAFPSQAAGSLDLATIGGPLGNALSTLGGMEAGVKALIAFIAFIVALISLAALRNFGPVLFFIGVAIFASTGLVVAGQIMGADMAVLAAAV